ncbi:MAG: AAA family ATPase [Bacteroidota bacterium]
MVIEKVSIQNYRNFRNFEVELQQFNVIVGENNIGKTNLLNAISLILTPDITFLQKRILELDDINYAAVINFKRQLVIENNFEKIKFPEVKIEIQLSDFTEAQEAIVGDWLTGSWNSDIKKNKAKITYVFSANRLKELNEWFDKTKKEMSELDDETKEQFVDFPIRYYSYIIYGGDYTERRIDYYWLNLLKMEFLDAMREPKTNLLAGRTNSLLYKILRNKTENKIPDIKDKLKELQKTINKSEFKNISEEIREYLQKISIEGSDNNIKFDFTGIDTSEILKRINLFYGTEPISIERNGLGRNNLLFIALLLSQITNKKNGKNIKEKKDVYYRLITIEEPEAHLHPHLQIHLSRNIKDESNEEAQIIITSHSTHITSQLQLDNIIVLYNDIEDQNIKSYYLKNLPQDSKEYMIKFLDATKSTMFFARKIILIEGIAEQILVPFFFSKYNKEGKTLEQYGISLVNVNGVAFEHFLRIIKRGYFIKCLVLTDSDSDKTTAHRAKTLIRAYESNNKINIKVSQESTFEKDVIFFNRDGAGKRLLLDALVATRKNKGSNLKNSSGENELDIENFYKVIYYRNRNYKQDYKAEFAINLLKILQNNQNIIDEFKIPMYIEEGFRFLLE